METQREKFLIRNTLLCLLKTVEGKKTTVEMRDEKEAKGRIVKVDGFMNVTMKNVTFKSLKGKSNFEQFFINGKNIRYVHIPDEIDMRKAMEAQLKMTDTSAANLKVQKDIKDAAWQKMKMKERKRLKEEKQSSSKS